MCSFCGRVHLFMCAYLRDVECVGERACMCYGCLLHTHSQFPRRLCATHSPTHDVPSSLTWLFPIVFSLSFSHLPSHFPPLSLVRALFPTTRSSLSPSLSPLRAALQRHRHTFQEHHVSSGQVCPPQGCSAVILQNTLQTPCRTGEMILSEIQYKKGRDVHSLCV
jgi:hypothetical protein